MQEGENNLEMNKNQNNMFNRGILQVVGYKLILDCGKSTTSKRGQKYFLDKIKMDGELEG